MASSFLFIANNFGVGGRAFFIAVGDLNNDADLDLVVTTFGDKLVRILLGNGDGSFVAAGGFSLNTPTSVVIGNFN